MSNKTQQQRLLKLLTDRKEKGVPVYEMIAPQPMGLGIAQYNARIFELRGLGYNIVNIEEGHFVLDPSSVSTVSQEPEATAVQPTFVVKNIFVEVKDRQKKLKRKITEVELRRIGTQGKELDRCNAELRFLQTQMDILERALPTESSQPEVKGETVV